MNILIADDEAPARERLCRLIDELGPPYQTIGQAENGIGVIEFCSRLKPDLVLLDIRMPSMDGIDAARALAALDEAPAVVFVTAYDSHAVQAFDANAIDYLLKPIRKSRLEQALNKATAFNQTRWQNVQRSLLPPESQQRAYLGAKARGELQLIPISHVRYCRADQKYVTVRTNERELLVDESLKALEQEFPDRFIRVHRNALVALNYIEALKKTPSGQFHVELNGISEAVVVSRRHLSTLRSALRHRLNDRPDSDV